MPKVGLLDYRAALGFLGNASGKEPACQCRRHKEMQAPSLGREDLLEEGMATHSSILAWRIPMVRGARSMASQRMGHDLTTERI